MFVPQSSPLFLPISHCFRAWSKINLKVYDVIICRNKNLTHFVWYLEKEKRYDIETLSIDRVFNKEHFIEKSPRKCATKASPKLLFYFGITKNNHCMQEILLEIRHYRRGYQKALKKLILFFLANRVPFSGQSYQK